MKVVVIMKDDGKPGHMFHISQGKHNSVFAQGGGCRVFSDFPYTVPTKMKSRTYWPAEGKP